MSESHKKCEMKSREFVKRHSNPSLSVQNIGKRDENMKVKYHKGVEKIFKCVIFLVKNGLPLRGHDETMQSESKGNLLELIEFLESETSKILLLEIIPSHTFGCLRP